MEALKAKTAPPPLPDTTVPESDTTYGGHTTTVNLTTVSGRPGGKKKTAKPKMSAKEKKERNVR